MWLTAKKAGNSLGFAPDHIGCGSLRRNRVRAAQALRLPVRCSQGTDERGAGVSEKSKRDMLALANKIERARMVMSLIMFFVGLLFIAGYQIHAIGEAAADRSRINEHP